MDSEAPSHILRLDSAEPKNIPAKEHAVITHSIAGIIFRYFQSFNLYLKDMDYEMPLGIPYNMGSAS